MPSFVRPGRPVLVCFALLFTVALGGGPGAHAQEASPRAGASAKAVRAPGPLLGSTSETDGPAGAEAYGEAVVPLGDIDGNGVVDLAVGAPFTPDETGEATGAVYVHRMNADGSVLSTTSIDSTDIPDGLLSFPNSSRPRFGHGVAAIGDIDGNGVTDLAIGAPGDPTSDNNDDNVNDCLDDGAGYPPTDSGADGRSCSSSVGALYIVRLDASGEVLGSVEKYDDTHPALDLDNPTTISGISTGVGNAKFGRGVAFLGDLDGPGTGHDFVVVAGTPGYIEDPNTEDDQSPGGFVVMEMTWDGASTSLYDVDYVFEDQLAAAGLGLTDDDDFGEHVSAVGDLNGDGVSELAFGTPYYESGTADGPPPGAVYVVDLSLGGGVAIDGFDRIGNGAGGLQRALADGALFGSSVAGAGDLDGNGVPDLLVGLEGDDGPGDATDYAGAAMVLYMQHEGGASTVAEEFLVRDGANGFSLPQRTLDRLGAGIALLPDEDGDGAPSLVAGLTEGSVDDKGSIAVAEFAPPTFGAELAVTGRTDNGSDTPDRSDATVDPGDVLTYTVTAVNTGRLKVTGHTVEVPLPAALTLVPGSVASPTGVVTSGNATEQTIVVEDWGTPVDGAETVAAGAVHDGTATPTQVTLTFAATLADPFPAQPTPPSVTVQGEWTTDNAGAVVTDNPAVGGFENATVTAVDAAPRLVAEMTDTQQADGDGDGRVDPGDRLGYTVSLQNVGDQDAEGVVFTSTPDQPAAVDQPSLTLVDGSVTVTAGDGTVASSSGTAQVDLGALTGRPIGGTGEAATLAMSADVNSPPEATAGQPPFVGTVQAQGQLTVGNGDDVSTDDPETGAAGDATAMAVPTADLQVATTVDNANPAQGGDVTVSVALTNNAASPDAAGGVTLDVPLPAGLTFVAASGAAAATYNPGAGDVEWNPGSVPVGDTKTLDVTATLTTTAATAVAASITGAAPRDPVGGNDTDDVTVEALAADLSLVLSAPSTAVYGTSYDYTLTLTNDGPGTGRAVAVTPALPADVSVQSVAGDAASSYDPANGDDVWTVGDVPSGETRSLTVTVQMDAPSGTLTATAEVTAQDTRDDDSTPGDGEGDDYATADVGATLPTLAIAAPTVPEGNSGTSTATLDVTLSEAIAYPVTVDYATQDGSATTADGDYTAASGTLTIAAGETAKTVPVSVAGDVTFEGDETFDGVLSSPSSATLATGKATVTITGDDAPPALAINDTTATEGDGTLDATVTLSNPSAQAVMVDVETQDGTATAGADYTALSTTLTIPAGTVEQAVSVPLADDDADEAAEAFAVTLSTPTNATLADDTGAATIADNDTDLALGLSASTTAPSRGADVVFTLTVTGGQTATGGVAVTGALPSGLSFVSAAGDRAGTYDPGAGDDVWNVGDVAAGGTATLDVTATYMATAPVTYAASITGRALNDPVAANDAASVQLTQAEADLALAMSQNEAQPQRGGTLTYTLELENQSGSGAATGVEVTNMLPDGLAYDTATPQVGSFDAGTGVWALEAPLAAGDVALLDLTVAVNTLDPVVNAAEVTAAATRDPDSTPGNGATGEDDYATAQADPLPVELVSFGGTSAGEAVALRWQTASETNNAGFRVQRLVGRAGSVGSPGAETDRTTGMTSGPRSVSTEDKNWQTVGSVDGAGTTTKVQSYAFTDTGIPYDADSLTYRLRQVDTDGTTSYSDPITVARSGVEAVQLLGTYPNPARSRATVRFSVPEGTASDPGSRPGQGVTLRLYDVLGRQVRTVRSGAKAGRHELRLDTSRLPSGTYFLRLQVGAATQTQQVTVVQ